MKTLLLTASYLVGIGELILAGYFWKTNSKNEIRKVMALLAFSTGVWVLTSAFTSYVSQTPLTTFFMRIVFVSGVILVTALLHLSLIYPFQIARLDRLHRWLLYAPTFQWVFIAFFTNAIVEGFTGSATDSGRIIPGLLYTFYNLYVFGLYLVALVMFFWRMRYTEGQHKQNLELIAWSVFIGGLPAVMIDLLIPVITKGVYPNANYGAISTITWLGVTTYIIRKNK